MTAEKRLRAERVAALPRQAREAIAELVRNWPPFTPEQRATLVHLLTDPTRVAEQPTRRAA